MIRLLPIASLVLLVGCADQSRGAALNACRMQYFLDSPDVQGQAIPDCMRAKSFEAVAACSPEDNPHQWDWRVTTFAYDNPKCYRPVGSAAWLATALSPM